MTETSSVVLVPLLTPNTSISPLTFQIHTTNGTALAGVDYVATNGSYYIPNFHWGNTSYFPVPLILDNVYEAPKKFGLVLSNVVGGYLSSPSYIEVEILEADGPGSFRFTTNRFRTNETNTFATVEVERVGGAFGTVAVDYQAASGTAIAGNDFVATNGVLAFANGETNKTIFIPLLNDTEFELAEIFSVTLSNPSAGALLADLVSTQVEIVNDDPVSNICSVTDLTEAVRIGGNYVFGCDGKFILTNTLEVNTQVRLDANGHQVTLSGASSRRHFIVNAGGILDLHGIQLIDGANGGGTGQNGIGASIYNLGGHVRASACIFSNNAALGGPGISSQRVGGFGGLGSGGAIETTGGTLSLTNVTFKKNTVRGGQGGGCDCLPGTIYGWGGDSRGAAIVCTQGAIVTAVNCAFTQNRAEPGTPGPGSVGDWGEVVGGAAYAADSSLTFRGCTFADNIGGYFGPEGSSSLMQQRGAARGGALYFKTTNSTHQLVIENCHFATNQVRGTSGSSSVKNQVGTGGAIHIANGTATINGSTFVANFVQGGIKTKILPADYPGGGETGDGIGGALCLQGTVTLRNCTLVNNTASGGETTIQYRSGSGYGGAIASLGGTTLIANCTIAGNIARTSNQGLPGTAVALGGAIYSTNGTVTLRNSIVSGGPTIGNCGGQAVIDAGNNLSTDSSCSFTDPQSLSSIDPRLASLADYGGPTLTMALLPDSPAIDRGDSNNCESVDQRGITRPQLLSCDAGSFEFIPDLFYLRSVALNGQSLQLAGIGVPAKNYRLQCSPNLVDWQDLASGIVPASGWIEKETTNGVAHCFFRIISP